MHYTCSLCFLVFIMVTIVYIQQQVPPTASEINISEADLGLLQQSRWSTL